MVFVWISTIVIPSWMYRYTYRLCAERSMGALRVGCSKHAATLVTRTIRAHTRAHLLKIAQAARAPARTHFIVKKKSPRMAGLDAIFLYRTLISDNTFYPSTCHARLRALRRHISKKYAHGLHTNFIIPHARGNPLAGADHAT
jgi:hypothetical protein